MEKPYQHALIDFMNSKKRKLKFGKYFIKKDERVLLAFPSKTAKEIWLSIKGFTKRVSDCGGLQYPTCPFCILLGVTSTLKQNKCVDCTYRTNHKGTCFTSDDDLTHWYDAKAKMNNFGKFIYLDTLLPSLFIKKTIVRISKKYNI